MNYGLLMPLALGSCHNPGRKPQKETDPQEASSVADSSSHVFPYGDIPREKPNFPLSAAMQRVYRGSYTGLENATNELFSRFKYTPLEGLDYRNHDGTISHRDATKIIKVNGTYYVWYTHRDTTYPPDEEGGNDSIPSLDWDLAEIWYATSKDGFTWQEQGVAIPRLEKPAPGWRSVSTPDILEAVLKPFLLAKRRIQR